MYESFLHEWFDQIWNKGNVDAVHRLLAPVGVIHDLAQDGTDSTGPSEFLAFFHQYRDAFPDIHIDVHETVTQGDVTAGRWTVKATHSGPGLGFPPTNRPISVAGMCFARIRDGRVVEAWNIWNVTAMRAQLGFTSIPPVAN